VAFSHDRAFLDRVATRILSFEGRSLGDARGVFSELRRAGRVLADHPPAPDVSRLPRGRRHPAAGPGAAQGSGGQAAAPGPRGADPRDRRAELERQAGEAQTRIQQLLERMADPGMALDWEGLERLSQEKKAVEREREACLLELAGLPPAAGGEE